MRAQLRAPYHAYPLDGSLRPCDVTLGTFVFPHTSVDWSGVEVDADRLELWFWQTCTRDEAWVQHMMQRNVSPENCSLFGTLFDRGDVPYLCNHVEYMIDLALMDDHSLRKKDTAILITTGHPDASVYYDDGYDWDSSPHIIWQPPVDGESGGGMCRDYYEKDGSNSVRYSFWPNHGWLTLNEYPHVKKECKCVSHAKAKGFSFT